MRAGGRRGWRSVGRGIVIVSISLGAVTASDVVSAQEVESCESEPLLAPPVSTVVVIDETEGDLADVRAEVDASAGRLAVVGRIAIRPTERGPDGRTDPGGSIPGRTDPGGIDPRPTDPNGSDPDKPPGPGQPVPTTAVPPVVTDGGWTSVADAAEVAATVSAMVAPGGLGFVVVVVGPTEVADELRRTTPREVAVGAAVDPADAGIDALVPVAREAEARLAGARLPELQATAGQADVRRLEDGWVIDLPGRLSAQVARVTAVEVVTSGRPPSDPPPEVDCGGGDLPVVIDGRDLEGAELTLTIDVEGLGVGSSQAFLDPASPSVQVPTTTSPEDDRDETGADDDDDDDDERAVGSPAASSEGGGGGALLPVLLGCGVLALLVGVALVLNRNRSVAPGLGFAGVGPAPAGAPDPAFAAPAPPPPPPAAPVEPPPPPPPAPSSPDPAWVVADPGDRPIAVPASAGAFPAHHHDGRRSWALAHPSGIYLGGWFERVPDHGEDAAPLVQVHDGGAAVIGVFDGTGGAGSTIVRRELDGLERTSAWVGSRLAREVTADWAVAAAAGADDPDHPTLEPRLRSWFHLHDAGLGEQPVVKGSLHRSLPTTLAVVTTTPEAGRLRTDVLWAGDSRCYSLRPDTGLQVLSRDDTRESDALALIRNDQPMLNLVSADRAFTIHHTTVRVVAPAVFVVATDGCFGYVATPAHFEIIVLESLVSADSVEEWAARLLQRLDAVAGDDASFAIACPGVHDLGVLQRAVAPRLVQLREQHWTPFVDAVDDAEREALRQTSWDAYRTTYEARLPEASR